VTGSARLDGLPLEDARCRVALGQALIRRAPDVACAVVAEWTARFVYRGIPFETLRGTLAGSSQLGTELVGRYFATGKGATPEESRAMADRSSMVVLGTAMTAVVKNYLRWRDATIRVLHEEAARLDSPPALVREVVSVVRFSADVTIITMIRQFDVQRRELESNLEQERAKLSYLALHDCLTGLGNRALLLDRLAHAIAGTARRQEQVGVLFLDLDGFKAVNDSHGHEAGDRLLVAVAQRLTRIVRPSDTLARVGGDEFVVVCDDLTDGQRGLDAFAQRIQVGVSGPVAASPDLLVSVSVGGAVAAFGDDPENVLAAADAAMYEVKKRRRASA
jgi:diguanylate cyclase (GGDEF)-like protein